MEGLQPRLNSTRPRTQWIRVDKEPPSSAVPYLYGGVVASDIVEHPHVAVTQGQQQLALRVKAEFNDVS